MIARRIILAVLWILSIVAISFYGGPLSYGFFFAVNLIPLISFIYTFVVYTRFRMYQSTDSVNIICRSGTPYMLTLQNEDKFAFSCVGIRFYSDLSYVPDINEYEEYELLPGDNIKIEKQLICKYCGEYLVGANEVTFTDFFRIFRFKYKNQCELKAFVFPRKIALSTLRSANDMMIVSKRENKHDASEPGFDLRDFVPGDRLKDIHWNATAKEGILKIRNRVGEERQEIYFYLDNKLIKGKLIDTLPVYSQAKEATIALCLYLLKNKIPVRACLNEHSILMSNDEGFDSFYQLVAEMKFEDENTTATKFLMNVNKALAQRLNSFWAVVFDMDVNLYNELINASNMGIYIIVFVIADKPEGIEYINTERVKIIYVSPDSSLEDVL